MSKIPVHYYNITGLLMVILPILGRLSWGLYVAGGFQLILFWNGLCIYVALCVYLLTKE